ncbi:MAG: mechanosensitive ion channel [Methanobrevibacter sp.]|uniref:mechanosensitive ion channel family protein n=1 Tax=Methanobrevibacter sp. TaxID=66852 RepID=UPI001B7AAF2B|nr:mechanosensitive ion channel domain-containing protein [Methanobrevibacter sp.]MBP3791779.1 mechanosensitive ion channel [Methanobrevibacter sp.]
MIFPNFNDPATYVLYPLLVVIIAYIATRVTAHALNRMNKYKDDMTAIYLIRDIITAVIYFVALMIVLQVFGINLAGTLLSVGIVGIAVSFAAKDIISNLFSGIMLILGRSVKVGDTIEINDKKGYVEKISLRSTVLVDDYGVRNNVPNSTLTNNEYLQFKDTEMYRVDIFAGMPLDIDMVNFREYLIKKMKSYPEISDKPQPDVYGREISFKQSKVKVSFWVKDFNDKDKYKLIIINEIRKYMEKGENDE